MSEGLPDHTACSELQSLMAQEWQLLPRRLHGSQVQGTSFQASAGITGMATTPGMAIALALVRFYLAFPP